MVFFFVVVVILFCVEFLISNSILKYGYCHEVVVKHLDADKRNCVILKGSRDLQSMILRRILGSLGRREELAFALFCDTSQSILFLPSQFLINMS